jgi:hypothetical protein
MRLCSQGHHQEGVSVENARQLVNGQGAGPEIRTGDDDHAIAGHTEHSKQRNDHSHRQTQQQGQQQPPQPLMSFDAPPVDQPNQDFDHTRNMSASGDEVSDPSSHHNVTCANQRFDPLPIHLLYAPDEIHRLTGSHLYPPLPAQTSSVSWQNTPCSRSTRSISLVSIYTDKCEGQGPLNSEADALETR